MFGAEDASPMLCSREMACAASPGSSPSSISTDVSWMEELHERNMEAMWLCMVEMPS